MGVSGQGGQRLLEPEAFPLPLVAEPEGQKDAQGSKVLVLAGGCFWCVEGVFLELAGVSRVVSGYAGGQAETADYEQVCSGLTGHAEVVQITYDPAIISRGQLLQVFFSVAHNPTHLNHQGADRGTQYRSAIFHVTPQEKQQAADYIVQLNAVKAWSEPLATVLEPLETFYPAEAYHQNYAARNPHQPYIQAVAQPKRQQVKAHFADWLEPDA